MFLFFLTMAGCGGPKINLDFDPGVNFSRLRNYTWQPQTDKKSDNPLIDERIRFAVDQVLNEKNYQMISSGKADFSVDYRYQISRASPSSDVHTGVGIGGGSSGMFGGISIGTFGFGNDKDQATLTINIYDTFSGRLIWQGSNTRRAPELSNPAASAAEIIRQVDAILAKFPPIH